MTEFTNPFAEEINANRSAETVATHTTEISNGVSTLAIRDRGCFIVDCGLVSARTGERVNVLHSDPDISVAKLSASHIMSPVGPSQELGGQHGFPRWADYHEFAQNDGPNGEKLVAFQAMRSDDGLGIAKVFELTDGTLESRTTVFNNSETDSTQTSHGEHYYFALEDEKSLGGLTINGKTIEEHFGRGAESSLMAGEPFFWSISDILDGEPEIHFPAGHTIRLLAAFTGEAPAEPGMLIWHRPGSPSICFEPTVGFDPATAENDGIEIPPYGSATLVSKIEVL